MSLSRASECFRLTNLTITFLSWPLLYLESGILWQPSISFGSISTPESLQYLPCSQDLYQECCSVCLIFQRCFCGYIAPPSPDFFQDKLLRSSLRLTFFTIALSLWSFLFSVSETYACLSVWATLRICQQISKKLHDDVLRYRKFSLG